MVVVMTPGPPPVKTYIISKVLKASIARNKITVISIGLIKGMQIYLNIWGLEAPSTMAASRGSEGRDRRAAYSSKNVKGVHSITSIKIKV